MNAPHPQPHLLFVYGTLQPGQSRWHHLAPFIAGDGADDAVDGSLYDTGLGYPAARFDTTNVIMGDVIIGKVYELADVARAVEHLDDVEGAVRGLYRRVVVRTHAGDVAWAYECGDESLLVRHLPGGDWSQASSTGSWG